VITIHHIMIPFLMPRRGVTVMDPVIVAHGIFMTVVHVAKSGATMITAGGNISILPAIYTNKEGK
jgi:hypothetical protein